MRVPENVKCRVCKRIFCCPSCREQHEALDHAEVPLIVLNCFICNGKSLSLKESLSNRHLLDHIAAAHLPVHCRKCSKVFQSRSELEEFGKCATPKMDRPEVIQEELAEEDKAEDKVDANKENATNEAIDEALLTPLTKINLKWRRKSAGFQASLTDSASTIPNASTLSQNTISPKKKIVRTTSTPMTRCLPIETAKSASLTASSINTTDSSDRHTPLSAAASITPMSDMPKVAAEPRHRSRPRLPVACTPLRQVMSKSIQRAFLERGYTLPTAGVPARAPRKMTFDSTLSTSGEVSQTPPMSPAVAAAALDLRTTPTLRRASSDPVPLIATKLESLDTSTTSLVPLTPQPKLVILEPDAKQDSFLEAVTPPEGEKATAEPDGDLIVFEKSVNVSSPERTRESFESCIGEPLLTPTAMKKAISFVTPMMSSSEKSNKANETVWYTPRALEETIRPARAEQKVEDKEEVENEAPRPQGRFWRFVSSVLRLAGNTKSPQRPAASNMSFLKRRRGPSKSPTSSEGDNPSPIAKKYKRIQPRRALERMRNHV